MSSYSSRLPGWLAAATLVLAASLPAAAAPVTLDFEETAIGSYLGGGYQHAGFTLTTPPAQALLLGDGYDLGGHFMAGWSISNFDGGVQITLARADGGLFRLDGIDLAVVGDGADDVRFQAYDTAGALRATQTFAAVDIAVGDFTRFVFGDGFHDVARVVWTQAPSGMPWLGHAFDNIRLDQPAVQDVPEPGSLALAGVALAGLAMARRQRV